MKHYLSTSLLAKYMTESLFETGNLLRISKYVFADGGDDRDKYMIVLNFDDENLYVIHCLTTSKNKQERLAHSYGCNKDKGQHFWYIPPGKIIGDKNYFFDEHTFIFFYNNIRKCEISYFDKQKAKGLFGGIAPLGRLSNQDLKELISCIIKSEYAPEEIEDELIYLKGKL